MPSPPQRFTYSPSSSSSSSHASASRSFPSTTQIIIYSTLALGLVLATVLLCALLRSLRARRARAKSRETRKRAMIDAAATAIIGRNGEAGGEGGWVGGDVSEGRAGIKMCCYRRTEEKADELEGRSIEWKPEVGLPRESFVSRSLRGSRLVGEGKKESTADVNLRETDFGVCWEGGKDGVMTEVKEENVTGERNTGVVDKKNQIAGGQIERNDEPVVPPSASRQQSVKASEPCLAAPAAEQGTKLPAANLRTAIPLPKLSTTHPSVKSDDMFQRRNKAKSLELLHLKSRLAYPAPVHSALARVELAQQDTSSNQTSVARWIRGSGRLQDSIAMKMISENLEGREESWQTLDQRVTDLDMLQAKEFNTLNEAADVDHARKNDEGDRRQGAGLVLDSQWSGVSRAERSTGTYEDEWEDVSDMGSLATRSSEISLCASPTRAREL